MTKGLQVFAKVAQCVTVARSGGIRRYFERFANLLKGEFLPDLEHQDLALLGWQSTKCSFDILPPFIAFAGQFLEGCLAVLKSAVGPLLPHRAPVFTTCEVQRRPPDGSDQQSLGVAGQVTLMAPVPNESILKHIFGIGQ